MTSTFAASPNYAWTVESESISVDGSLTLTSDETGFGLRGGAVEIRNQQVSGSSPLAGSRFSPSFSETYRLPPNFGLVASARVGCT